MGTVTHANNKNICDMFEILKILMYTLIFTLDIVQPAFNHTNLLALAFTGSFGINAKEPKQS